jgi:hypothetical protein
VISLLTNFSWTYQFFVPFALGAVSGLIGYLQAKKNAKGKKWWVGAMSSSVSGGLAAVAGTILVVDHSSLDKIVGASILLGYKGTSWLDANVSLVNHGTASSLENTRQQALEDVVDKEKEIRQKRSLKELNVGAEKEREVRQKGKVKELNGKNGSSNK